MCRLQREFEQLAIGGQESLGLERLCECVTGDDLFHFSIPAHLLAGCVCGTVATTRDRELGVMPSSAAAVSISFKALFAMHSAGFGSG